ncbi:phage tail protein [Wenzhouxiangella sp. AB-CW3]|uniref:phage tail protein n=1 Tax=Wenzhouxiangella sp. AB-CW3 TaxID=2771012 RepID=UPI00168AB4BA|nr:tail fiber protein [Wenzhouxiangella sp. AB-CW3]QOC22936.1 phage tail protein [Wenzhouxiangella sp. AB-CW3]
MADPFVAEIRMFPFNFAPRGWAWCDGQLLPLSQHTALFALLGTTYGGNGKSNFALPDLQGCVPMQPGQGPGLTSRSLGESGGTETVTLTESELPEHDHSLMATGMLANRTSPVGNSIARPSAGSSFKPSSGESLTAMASQALAPAGGNLPHNNMQPYLTCYFAIALQGVFPPRD